MLCIRNDSFGVADQMKQFKLDLKDEEIEKITISNGATYQLVLKVGLTNQALKRQRTGPYCLD